MTKEYMNLHCTECDSEILRAVINNHLLRICDTKILRIKYILCKNMQKKSIYSFSAEGS